LISLSAFPPGGVIAIELAADGDMDGDSALLRQFLATRDQRAFAELARRHVDLVYSAARRQVRNDSATAQDITQQVFVLLAEKAGTIRDGEAVAGWLLVTTRYVALNWLRTEGRRRRHEREAAVMHEQQRAGDTPAWETVGPMLDEVVAKLKREDRDALALRYFQGRSVADVAVALGVSQEAAQKRLSRAIDRLREMFARRGVTTSADALSSVLMANALIVAPAALGTSVAGAALSGAAAATGATSSAAKGAVTIMAIAKTKVAAASVAAVLLVGVTGTIAYQQIRTPGGRSRQVKVDPAATTQSPAISGGTLTFESFNPTTTTNPAWRARFDELYLLAPGETMKRVHTPFVPERLTYYQLTSGTGQVQAIPKGPDAMLLTQGPPQGLKTQSMMFGGSQDVRGVLRDVVGIAPQETDLPRDILRRNLPGDWVVRESSPVAERMAAFTQLLSQQIGRTYRSEVRPLEREVIVVRGTYAYRPLPDVPEEQYGATIHFYVGQPEKKPSGFGGSGGAFRGLFAHLGDLSGRQIIIETELPSRGAGSYKDHASVQPFHRKEMDAATLDLLLANVEKQTSFELKRERRVVPTWVFTPTAN
jgi:RNA polymerase sigma factor (sigma-70 family)